jgi:hypothetical protein
VNLRFNNDKVGLEPRRAFAGFFFGESDFSAGGGHTIACQDSFGLVLVNLHQSSVFGRGTPASVRIWHSQNIEVYSERDRGARTRQNGWHLETIRTSWPLGCDWAGAAMTHRLLDHAIAGHALNGTQAEELMEELLSGRLVTAEIVQLLSALNERPYRSEELAGFARAMRHHAVRVFADGGNLAGPDG